MRHIDASAVLDLWENYPPDQFPAVWDWFESEFRLGELAIVEVAFKEVGHREPACKAHLESCGVSGFKITDAAIVNAAAIKSALEIVNDEYGSGVDENDILIIAAAKVEGVQLITNERLQTNRPAALKNYRIPAVCLMSNVSVISLRLIDYIRQSGRIFQ